MSDIKIVDALIKASLVAKNTIEENQSRKATVVGLIEEGEALMSYLPEVTKGRRTKPLLISRSAQWFMVAKIKAVLHSAIEDRSTVLSIMDLIYFAMQGKTGPSVHALTSQAQKEFEDVVFE